MYCSSCKESPARAGQRYCIGCHAVYMRAHRPRHIKLSEQQRTKANCRAYANVYKRRGRLVQEPCETCGSSESQMHHKDYSLPLAVTWLCRPCHLKLHNN